MKNICYECYETGCITEKEMYDIAQFVTVKKYDVLYTEELPRFRKQPLKIYALPYDDQPAKIYNGTGRMGLDLGDKQCKKLTDTQKQLSKKFFDDFNFADELMQEESTALQFLSLFEESDNFELIWVRNNETNHTIPEGYQFIGFDIAYPCDYSGSFSIICDCMFICRWHGCDEEGTLFLPEFNKLNENGLFDDWQSAYDYIMIIAETIQHILLLLSKFWKYYSTTFVLCQFVSFTGRDQFYRLWMYNSFLIQLFSHFCKCLMIMCTEQRVSKYSLEKYSV